MTLGRSPELSKCPTTNWYPHVVHSVCLHCRLPRVRAPGPPDSSLPASYSASVLFCLEFLFATSMSGPSPLVVCPLKTIIKGFSGPYHLSPNQGGPSVQEALQQTWMEKPRPEPRVPGIGSSQDIPAKCRAQSSVPATI